MTNRGDVGRVFSTLVLAAPLWAWSGGVASAQECLECPPPPPPEIVTCPVPGPVTCGEVGCSPDAVSCSNNPDTPFTSSQNENVKVFTFGRDNSIQVKFLAPLTCPINLTVTLTPTTQAQFQARLKSATCPNPPEPFFSYSGATCHETVSIDVPPGDDPTTFCAVYTLHADPPHCVGGTLSTDRVEYLVGWKAPDKGNKHDFYLLRDPDVDDELSPDPSICFTQNITVGTVIGNYKPGGVNDPGLGGRACCPSDYVVARQKKRPVTP